ncbi:hypothetical protein Gohar_018401 [Gossypium harknessii]|uniref:Uncharacterized protein n=1 Tax=Gossypium harknessii TaxID=34285 RepID=A0A7J9GA96_9ROSI|nr:hypothetical protein [Gossypium harknessii]
MPFHAFLFFTAVLTDPTGHRSRVYRFPTTNEVHCLVSAVGSYWCILVVPLLHRGTILLLSMSPPFFDSGQSFNSLSLFGSSSFWKAFKGSSMHSLERYYEKISREHCPQKQAIDDFSSIYNCSKELSALIICMRIDITPSSSKQAPSSSSIPSSSSNNINLASLMEAMQNLITRIEISDAHYIANEKILHDFWSKIGATVLQLIQFSNFFHLDQTESFHHT